jgi:hypothetical protein
VSGDQLLAARVGESGPGVPTRHPAIESAQAVAADARTAVVVSGSKLYVLDLAAQGPLPPIVRQVALPDPVLDVSYKEGSLAWVALPSRLLAVDLWSDAEPLAVVDTIETPRGIAVSGTEALVALGSMGLGWYRGPASSAPVDWSIFLPRALTVSRSSLTDSLAAPELAIRTGD